MSDSITCQKCGLTSYNINDIEHKYCGNCHEFIEFMDLEKEEDEKDDCSV